MINSIRIVFMRFILIGVDFMNVIFFTTSFFILTIFPLVFYYKRQTLSFMDKSILNQLNEEFQQFFTLNYINNKVNTFFHFIMIGVFLLLTYYRFFMCKPFDTSLFMCFLHCFLVVRGERWNIKAYDTTLAAVNLKLAVNKELPINADAHLSFMQKLLIRL